MDKSKIIIVVSIVIVVFFTVVVGILSVLFIYFTHKVFSATSLISPSIINNESTSEIETENTNINNMIYDSNEIDINGNILKVKGSNKEIPIGLKQGEEVYSADIDSAKKTLAIVISKGKGEGLSTRLIITNIQTGKEIKTFESDGYFLNSKGEKVYVEYLGTARFSNDDKYLYISYSAGGSGGRTLVMRLNDSRIINDCGGFLRSVLPTKENISNEYYRKYAGYLLLMSHHYYAIGGGPYLIDIVNPNNCIIEEQGILEADDNNESIKTFYDMYINN